jgi:hypothetical protein
VEKLNLFLDLLQSYKVSHQHVYLMVGDLGIVCRSGMTVMGSV